MWLINQLSHTHGWQTAKGDMMNNDTTQEVVDNILTGASSYLLAPMFNHGEYVCVDTCGAVWAFWELPTYDRREKEWIAAVEPQHVGNLDTKGTPLMFLKSGCAVDINGRKYVPSQETGTVKIRQKIVGAKANAA